MDIRSDEDWEQSPSVSTVGAAGVGVGEVAGGDGAVTTAPPPNPL